MLVEAVNWSTEREPLSSDEVLVRAELAHYIVGWPRADDVGVVVDDEEGKPIGAAWYRYLSAIDPGFGFVDPAIPEVSIGVVTEWRGRGVGTALLRALGVEASRRGVVSLSLSVEIANPAVRLYAREGFVAVRDDGSATTMRLDLCAP